MVTSPFANEAEPSPPEMDAVVLPPEFLTFSVPFWLLAPTVSAESNVPVVPATVLGVEPPMAPGDGKLVTSAEPLKLDPPMVRVVVSVAALPAVF